MNEGTGALSCPRCGERTGHHVHAFVDCEDEQRRVGIKYPECHSVLEIIRNLVDSDEETELWLEHRCDDEN